MATWHIERMGPEGWERVRSVRLRALADTPDAFGMTLAEEQARTEESWRARLANHAIATFLAVASGQDVGLTVTCAFDGRPDAAGLFAMWVAPECRGRGIAQALIDAVVAWAREQGFRRVLLDVADQNVAAARLYERMGFRPNGVTGNLGGSRQHILEHQRERLLGG